MMFIWSRIGCAPKPSNKKVWQPDVNAEHALFSTTDLIRTLCSQAWGGGLLRRPLGTRRAYRSRTGMSSTPSSQGSRTGARLRAKTESDSAGPTINVVYIYKL